MRKKLMHYFRDGANVVKILYIVSAEDQTIFYVTFYGTEDVYKRQEKRKNIYEQT